MSTATAIAVDRLGKRYVIGEAHPIFSGRSFRETISGALRGMPRALGRRGGRRPHVWALRDVSLDVAPGDVLGLIGRNGAGKSTLLKILTGITEPTEGAVELRGRVASLLEVGTGFHHELTGRENAFLNGAILGMPRREVSRKLDEIVAFAGVERFLDTPVKRYSSGMFLRLAFSVAAHLEPDILLVDEVLAVGDAAFQQKCLGKMDDVATSGRTVVFVSHNMGALERICRRCVTLADGRLVDDGSSREVISRYLASVVDRARVIDRPANPDKRMAIRRVAVQDEQGGGDDLRWDRPWSVEVTYDVNDEVEAGHVWLSLETVGGLTLLSVSDTDFSPAARARERGTWARRVTIPPGLLSPGEYSVSIGVGTPPNWAFDHVKDAVAVRLSDPEATAVADRPGFFQPSFSWSSNTPVDRRDVERSDVERGDAERGDAERNVLDAERDVLERAT